MSSIGAMFAPRHQDVAGELVRVCRRGGTIALPDRFGDRVEFRALERDVLEITAFERPHD